MRVIDIGCGIDSRSFDAYVPLNWHITGVDVISPERIRHQHQNFTFVQQDAQNLSRFNDDEFDLAVSIGTFEHITEKTAFLNAVSEIRRVAKQYIVVVPYRYAWIEPHFGVPLFPILPYFVQIALVRAFNLSGEGKVVKRDPDYIKKNYLWLSNSEYQVFFPDAEIYHLPTLETIAMIRRAEI